MKEYKSFDIIYKWIYDRILTVFSFNNVIGLKETSIWDVAISFWSLYQKGCTKGLFIKTSEIIYWGEAISMKPL